MNCQTGFAKTIPSISDLEENYGASYFNAEVGGEEADYTDYLSEKTALQRNFARRIKVLQKYSQSGMLLEVGCAYGFFLELAQQYWEVSGIEISDAAADYALKEFGFNVVQKEFENAELKPDSFDVIAMWDTIEHLYDPVTAIQLAAKSLKSGGIIAITTGDCSALLARIQRQNWRLLQPNHLFYFSSNSITYLLEENGFEVVHLSHNPIYRSLREMSKLLVWKENPSKWRVNLLNTVSAWSIMDWQIALNVYDIMFVIAVRH